MDSGAALRAKVISSLRSILYCPMGAMLGYGVLASCAWSDHAAPSKKSSVKLIRAIILKVFCFIAVSRDASSSRKTIQMLAACCLFSGRLGRSVDINVIQRCQRRLAFARYLQ